MVSCRHIEKTCRQYNIDSYYMIIAKMFFTSWTGERRGCSICSLEGKDSSLPNLNETLCNMSMKFGNALRTFNHF